jgi:hypothetical protein
MLKSILQPMLQSTLKSVLGDNNYWTLANTTTLQWHDMLQGITDAGSGKVSAWNDALGNTLRNVSQSTGANRPTLTTNGVEFNGTSDFLFNSNPYMYALSGGFHVICIMSAPANTSSAAQDGFVEASTASITPNYRILCKDNIIADYGKITQASRNNTSTNFFFFGGNTGLSNAWDNTFKIIEYIDTTTQISTAINCVAESSPITYSRSGSLTLNRYSVGAMVRSTNLNFMSMTLKCKAVFPANISLSDRQKAQGYLAHRYNVASLLPGDHPYKSSPPTI